MYKLDIDHILSDTVEIKLDSVSMYKVIIGIHEGVNH